MNNYCSKSSAGVTLIELLVVIAIAAILSAIAVPSFLSMIQRYRIQGETSNFVGDVQYARAEAIKRGLPASLCVINTTAVTPACAATASTTASTDWRTGWMVYTTDPADGSQDILRIQRAWSGTDTFLSNTNIVSFSRDGFTTTVTGTALVTFSARTVPVNLSAMKCVTLNKVGRQQTLTSGTTGCTS